MILLHGRCKWLVILEMCFHSYTCKVTYMLHCLDRKIKTFRNVKRSLGLEYLIIQKFCGIITFYYIMLE